MDPILHVGDARDVLATLPEESVQCCVTSPPYWGLRDYGHDAQLGVEDTPAEDVANLVRVLEQVRRLLKPDGVLWLNLGDSHYNYRTHAGGGMPGQSLHDLVSRGKPVSGCARRGLRQEGLKSKDLVGVPWRAAFALQDAGWWLRSDCIWHKPNPMPESVSDRPTRAHEYVFLLTKSERYYYNAKEAREPAVQSGRVRADRIGGEKYGEGVKHSDGAVFTGANDRNWRTVWSIPTQPFSGGHFATMPTALAERCVLSGSRPGDVVLDPFNGAGTTGMVALQRGRSFVGVEINPDYADMARQRWVTHSAQGAFL